MKVIRAEPLQHQRRIREVHFLEKRIAYVSQVWTVRDGKVARRLVFDTREEALEAAGLSE